MQSTTTGKPTIHALHERSMNYGITDIAPAGILTAVMLLPNISAWAEMWLIAGALFFLFKWLTWSDRAPRYSCVGKRRKWAYFFGWVGMDADEFLRPSCSVKQAHFGEWALALGNTLLGAVVLWGLIRRLPEDQPIEIGGLGFAGLVLFLHFGLFHLLALVWRQNGIAVEPIMRAPLLAISLADFWGQRWNRAYRRVSFDYFFRPAVTRFGLTAGTLVAFLASGLIHELVISVPARAGYGRPTMYFGIQGLGILFERTAICRWLTLRFAGCGWFYTLGFLLCPIGLLFHDSFLTRVIGPFLVVIGAR